MVDYFAGLSLDKPLIMGIINVTPDSFSDGGETFEHDQAIEKGLRQLEVGADIVDVGGESTRPGADPVGPEEESRRVVPVVSGLSGDVRVSIDTRHAEVARAAVAAGATVGNSAAIRPSIRGWARTTGHNTIFVDERDPYANGFQVV